MDASRCGGLFFVVLIFGVFLFPLCVSAALYHGRVVRVADGDTLTILDADNRQFKIRLSEIDAPELKQPYGKLAKETLSGFVAGRLVTVNVQGVDRYQRHLGRIFLDGQDINAELVRGGAAWVYRQYAQDTSLYLLEADAKSQRRGLWGLPESERVPPWEWRRRTRSAKMLSR